MSFAQQAIWELLMDAVVVDSFEVTKSILGGYRISYACPHCGSDLISKESDIQKEEWCPSCRKPFVISNNARTAIESDRQRLLGEKKLRKLAAHKRRMERAKQRALNSKAKQKQKDSLPKTVSPDQGGSGQSVLLNVLSVIGAIGFFVGAVLVVVGLFAISIVLEMAIDAPRHRRRRYRRRRRYYF